MEKFNEFLIEKTEEPLKPSELEIVVLGLSDEEGTFADLIQKVAKKRGMKHTLVDITQAYITSSDIEIGEVRLRNIDGEDKDVIDPEELHGTYPEEPVDNSFFTAKIHRRNNLKTEPVSLSESETDLEIEKELGIEKQVDVKYKVVKNEGFCSIM